MSLHKIEKGLDLPISGKPIQVVRGASPCTQVAVMADDFPGMKARMRVDEGDTVKRGQVLTSIERIAEASGVSKKVVRGAIKSLSEGGFLVDEPIRLTSH